MLDMATLQHTMTSEQPTHIVTVSTTSTGTAHTSAKARLTSVAIRIRIATKI